MKAGPQGVLYKQLSRKKSVRIRRDDILHAGDSFVWNSD